MLNKRGFTLISLLRLNRRSCQGFTLIELMVAISIVAILATIGIVSYSKVQSTARDAKRKQDLRSISVALELYRQKNGYYPATGGDWAGSRTDSSKTPQPWINGVDSNYITVVPKDPKGSDSDPLSSETNHGYFYWAGTSNAGNCPGNNLFYVIGARMENPDVDRYELKQNTFCDGNVLLSPSDANLYKNLYIITSQ